MKGFVSLESMDRQRIEAGPVRTEDVRSPTLGSERSMPGNLNAPEIES
jgi:hypothetical protein